MLLFVLAHLVIEIEILFMDLFIFSICRMIVIVGRWVFEFQNDASWLIEYIDVSIVFFTSKSCDIHKYDRNIVQSIGY